MAKTFNCKCCKEHTVYSIVSFDKENNFGDFRECNLCGDIAKMVRRQTEGKKRKEELLDWILNG